MADFWAGVAQGFGPAYQRSTDRRQLIEDRKLAREQSLKDAKKAAIDKIIDEYIRLGGKNTSAIDRRDKHTLLREIGVLEARNKRRAKKEAAKSLADERDYQENVRKKIRQEKLVDIKTGIEREAEKKRTEQEGILESFTPKAKEAALGGRTLFTGQQPLPATSWKGQELGPDVLKGLPLDDVGQIGKYDALSQAQMQGAVLAGQRVEKEEIVEKAAEKAAERDRKANLNPRWAKPELSTEDAIDQIMQMQGQLGQRVPTQSRQAVVEMGRDRIMRLWGGLKQQVAELGEEKRPVDIVKHEYLQDLREQLSKEKDPNKKTKIEQEIEDFTRDIWDKITLPDGSVLSRTRGSKGGGSGGTGSGSGLSTKQKEALDASEIALTEAGSILSEFGEDASKNLNIWNRATHKIKNIALPAVGVDTWADPKMASYRARVEKLSGQALAAMHKMHGGGMMSAADVVLYGKGIPNTDTYSPVAYNAKFKAWQQSMEGLVNYYKAKETMADLPAYISDLNPELAFKITGQKDPKTNKTILDNNTLKFLMGNSPNFKTTYDEVMDLVKNKNITFDQGLDWIEALKIDVPNRR